jgi:hypothetical protein
LCAAELQIPINIIFSEGLVKTIEVWQPLLRMDRLSSIIGLFNIVATTLEFSSISRSSDDRCHVPLNFYNMVLAQGCMKIIIRYANSKFLFYVFLLQIIGIIYR